MKVKELIEKLKEFDEELDVTYENREDHPRNFIPCSIDFVEKYCFRYSLLTHPPKIEEVVLIR